MNLPNSHEEKDLTCISILANTDSIGQAIELEKDLTCISFLAITDSILVAIVKCTSTDKSIYMVIGDNRDYVCSIAIHFWIMIVHLY